MMMSLRERPPGRLRSAARAAWRSLPGAMKVGFVLLAAGGLVDLTYHAVVGIHVEHLDGVGLASHLVVLAGMALSMAGVLQSAFQSRRRIERPAPTGGR